MNLGHRQLRTFAAVAELGSFERAAQRLHLTQSAVSQRIKQLEDAVGQLLIVRGQPLGLTAAGEKLLAYQRQQQLLEEELLRQLGCHSDSAYTSVAIALNADSLATWFLHAMQPLLRERRLLLDLRVADQDQTHRFLRRGEVSGCISSDAAPMQGCRCVALGSMTYRALASGDFYARYFADGVSAAALRQAPAVDYDLVDALQQRYLGQQFGIAGGDYPRHRVPSPDAYLQMIVQGLGWGMVPDLQSAALRQSGALVELSPGRRQAVALYWHRSSLGSTTLSAIEAALVGHAAAVLVPLDEL